MALYKPEDSPVYPTEYDKLVAVIAENERLRKRVQELEADKLTAEMALKMAEETK